MAVANEISLMYCLARADLSAEERERSFNFVQLGIDWELFTELILHHKVFPLVAKHLTDTGNDFLPAQLRQQYKRILRQHIVKSLLFSRSVLQSVALFEQKGITVVPFKGPVAAEQLYGDVSLRMYDDLDFLVDREDVAAVFVELQEQGFSPEFKISPSNLKTYLMIEDGISFSAKGQPEFDLTWELSGLSLPRPFDFRSVASDFRTLLFHGRQIRAFSAEDLLIYYCLHGCRHSWNLYDLVVCVGGHIETNTIDWTVVFERATGMSCRRVLLIGLLLAESLYGLNLPPSISTFIAQDRSVAEQAGTFQGMLSQKNISTVTKNLRFQRLRFQMKDSSSDALSYFLRISFNPSKAEWKLFYVSTPRLVFLYWLVRPFRVFYMGLVAVLQRS